MPCTGNSSCFPQGKQAAVVRHYPTFFPPVYSVFVSPYHCLWGLLFYDRWIYGIFNVRTILGACHTHEGGGRAGTNNDKCPEAHEPDMLVFLNWRTRRSVQFHRHTRKHSTSWARVEPRSLAVPNTSWWLSRWEQSATSPSDFAVCTGNDTHNTKWWGTADWN